MALTGFIHKAAQAGQQRLFELLVEEARRRGFDYVAYGRMGLGALDAGRAARLRYPAVMLNYPKEWQQHYFAQGFAKVDPVILNAPLNLAPYTWSQLQSGPLERAQRRVFEDAVQFGLCDGVSIPLHGPGCDVAVLSFARRRPRSDPAPALASLRLLALHFDLVYRQVTRRAAVPPIALTPRERDCLQWIADGKSNWDIGMILGISENTVRFHIKNLLRKLQAPSRTAAVVQAIRLGLIEPVNRFKR